MFMLNTTVFCQIHVHTACLKRLLAVGSMLAIKSSNYDHIEIYEIHELLLNICLLVVTNKYRLFLHKIVYCASSVSFGK